MYIIDYQKDTKIYRFGECPKIGQRRIKIRQQA